MSDRQLPGDLFAREMLHLLELLVGADACIDLRTERPTSTSSAFEGQLRVTVSSSRHTLTRLWP